MALNVLSCVLDQPMETADGDIQFRPRTGKAASAPLLPEVEAYLQLLLVVHLTNNKRYAEVPLHSHPAAPASLLVL